MTILSLPNGRLPGMWRKYIALSETASVAWMHNQRRQARSMDLMIRRTLVGVERLGKTAVLYR